MTVHDQSLLQRRFSSVCSVSSIVGVSINEPFSQPAVLRILRAVLIPQKLTDTNERVKAALICNFVRSNFVQCQGVTGGRTAVEYN